MNKTISKMLVAGSLILSSFSMTANADEIGIADGFLSDNQFYYETSMPDALSMLSNSGPNTDMVFAFNGSIEASQSFGTLMGTNGFNDFYADSFIVGLPLDAEGFPTGGIELWHHDTDPSGSFLLSQHDPAYTNTLWLVMSYNLGQNLFGGWDNEPGAGGDGETGTGWGWDTEFGEIEHCHGMTENQSGATNGFLASLTCAATVALAFGTEGAATPLAVIGCAGVGSGVGLGVSEMSGGQSCHPDH